MKNNFDDKPLKGISAKRGDDDRIECDRCKCLRDAAENTRQRVGPLSLDICLFCLEAMMEEAAIQGCSFKTEDGRCKK